jgi:hypothetical protein
MFPHIGKPRAGVGKTFMRRNINEMSGYAWSGGREDALFLDVTSYTSRQPAAPR